MEKRIAVKKKINLQSVVDILERFCRHLKIVVLLRLGQLGEIHQAGMLPLIVVPYLPGERRLTGAGLHLSL